MHPNPDPLLPEGWVYIEHPDLGTAEHPVKRTALHVWERSGWAERVAPAEEDVAAEGAASTASPRRVPRGVVADEQPKEA